MAMYSFLTVLAMAWLAAGEPTNLASGNGTGEASGNLRKPPQLPPDVPTASGPSCLCVFDIDRTLTGKQGTARNDCPADKEIFGVWDTAYGLGFLTISEAGQNLQNTFCKKCYMGIVSHGIATGRNSGKRSYLLQHVLVSKPFQALLHSNVQAAQWSIGTVHSPLAPMAAKPFKNPKHP